MDIAELFYRGHWIFRGQADDSWPLSSSLERELSRVGTQHSLAYERAILNGIRLASSSYPECRDLEWDDYLSWLALLQHHGCKTRLVDFTESFYVALYFALRDLPCISDGKSTGVSTVWAISRYFLDREPERLRVHTVTDGCKMRDYELFDIPGKQSWDLANTVISNYQDSLGYESPRGVAYYKPTRLTSRMIAQQGIFLVPLDIGISFQENLFDGLGLQPSEPPTECTDLAVVACALRHRAHIIKIRIPQSYNQDHRTLLSHLKMMNITEATVFPGLDGYARSLNYYAALSK